MSSELENPEIAELVDQYKQGYIGYVDAKNSVARLLIKMDICFDFYEANSKAKELLLGKDNIVYNSITEQDYEDAEA